MDKRVEVVYDKEGNAHNIVDFNDDYAGAKIGFWLFLFTEVMIFGSMFLIYAFYLFQYDGAFMESSGTLNLTLGGINTVILLISALCMGLSLVKLRNGDVLTCKRYIWLTIALALVFLSIKYVEWTTEINHGIYPGSEHLASLGNGTVMFFGLYFSITGLHGLHIILGIGAMLWVLRLIKTQKINPKNFVILENTALYWDLVHLVWVFVFPLFYLIY
jgi:cytochrome c oxidase subunit 3